MTAPASDDAVKAEDRCCRFLDKDGHLWPLSKLPPARRDLLLVTLLPLLAAVALFSLFYFTRERLFVGDIAEATLDRRAVLTADTVASRVSARPMVFVDFDAASLAGLGDPALIPPARTADALSRLAPLKPRLVVVDLDLTYVQDPADLAAVTSALRQLTAAGATVFLARPTLVDPQDETWRRFKRNPALEALIERDPNLLWVGVETYAGQDGVVRRTPLSVSAEVAGHREIVPTVGLATLLLERSQNAQAARTAFVAGMNGRGGCASAPSAGTLLFCTDKGPLRFAESAAQRIRYTFSWPLKHPGRQIGDSGRPQVIRLPAAPLLSADTAIADTMFRDAVVVIGSSANRIDSAQTPVGAMPGPMLLINLARGWLEFGPARSSSYAVGALIVVMVAALMIALTITILRLTPPPCRRWIKPHLPAIVATALWLLFMLIGDLDLSLSLLAIQYVVVQLVASAEFMPGERPRPVVDTPLGEPNAPA